jgi:demethylmenaquinone methyltransferase / 2-methoxy-6-polyprenyl-1,4-benzoquinol methylase
MPDEAKTEKARNPVEGDEQVPFGFEEVSPEEKTERVGGVFASVASRYDLMNDLMSAGIHRLWKADTMAKINPQPGETLYDIAGGTGDLAKLFIDHADRRSRDRRRLEVHARAVVCDINAAMLEAGRARRDMAPYEGRVDWVCGNAEALPFADRTADVLTIAFGIRNVTFRDKALAEFRRVLKPGGRLAILEFSHMTSGALQAAYDAYSFSVIPRLGGMVTGDRGSYQYLVESIRRFPRQDAFAREIEAAGFSGISVTNFSGGVAALHFAWAV